MSAYYQVKGVSNVVTLFRTYEAKTPYNVTPRNSVVKVEVIDTDELSDDEQQERTILERQVERAFYSAGRALTVLRDKKLYRNTHKNFEEYCRDRFGHSRQKSNYLIAAADVYYNLTTTGCQNLEKGELTTNGCQILPTTERQIRPLSKLQPEQQIEAWHLSVEQVGGKSPSSRVIQDVVQRIMQRTKIPNPYRKGEICILLPKNNPDLRGKGGCWGAVTHVGDFSCTIETWDGEYTVKIQHLLSLNLSDDGCKFMQELLVRLRSLHAAPNRDSATDSLLAFFGKEHKAFLTDAQEELLTVLERRAQLI